MCCCSCLVPRLHPTLHDHMNCSLAVPLSLGFPRQKYWSGSPFPSPGDHPDPGIEPTSAMAGSFFTTEPPEKPRGRLTVKLMKLLLSSPTRMAPMRADSLWEL